MSNRFRHKNETLHERILWTLHYLDSAVYTPSSALLPHTEHSDQLSLKDIYNSSNPIHGPGLGEKIHQSPRAIIRAFYDRAPL